MLNSLVAIRRLMIKIHSALRMAEIDSILNPCNKQDLWAEDLTLYREAFQAHWRLRSALINSIIIIQFELKMFIRQYHG